MKKLLLSILLGASLAAAGQRQYHVSATGSDQQDGSQQRPFRTINKASAIALPGDVITVHAGTYREWINPPRGGLSDTKRITYQAAPGEKVVIKGSEPVKGWVSLGNGTWRLALHDSFFGNYNPYADLIFGDWFFPGRRKLHTGEVYIDGQPLYEVDSATQVLRGDMPKPAFGAVGIPAEALRRTWATQHEGDSTILYANFHDSDPNQSLVEINARPACFYPTQTGINYITIRGFHFSQAATQWAAPTAEQIGLIGTNWSRGWVIEDNEVSDSKCVGITLGKDRTSGHNVWFQQMNIDGAIHYNKMVERVIANGWNKRHIGSHIVRRNTIYRCGAAGICGSFGAAFSTITGNHIYDICTYRPFWGAEMAGIKFHGAIDAVIAGNRIHNAKIGLWLDWMTQGTRISSNLFYSNDFVDFYPEVNHGPYLVDNNLFLSGMSLRDWSEGGAYVHNLFAGVIGFTPQERETPYFKPHSTELVTIKDIRGGDNRFINNIFIGSRGRDYILPPQIATGWDELDTVKGRGISVYEHAVQPVVASGNLYLYGAFGLPGEKAAAYFPAFNPQLEITEQAGEVYLELSLPAKIPALSLVNTATLGSTLVSKQAYTDANDQPFLFSSDYLGKRRDAATTAGPFANKREKITIKVWPR